jgi:hypothetical protein
LVKGELNIFKAIAKSTQMPKLRYPSTSDINQPYQVIQNGSSIISDYNNSLSRQNLDYSNITILFRQSTLLLKTGFGSRETNNQAENSEKTTIL